jgi:hypothetical protein
MIRRRPVLLVALAAISVSACAGLKGRPTDAQIAPAASTPVTPVAPSVEPNLPKPAASAVAPRSCVPRNLASPPRYPDSDLALRDAAGAADRYQLMAAGRLMRQRRLDELERIIAGCR